MNINAQLKLAKGFTLVELMIVIVIIAILLTVAAPSFRNFVAQQRLRSASMDLRMALTMARSEAVKRNANVTLARIDGDWSNGWVVQDPVDATVALLTYSLAQDVVVAGPGADITFRPTGRITAGAQTDFDVSVPGVSAAEPSCVQLFVTGRSESEKGSC
ncbi:GspH/FimT family pseudopilin [Congregibacter sp.]|uniref:GspH/FimT family pseudopilin n=1 Tax=Congregibacter sp. TaxID=2744308 RepID=UPI003F6AAA9A